MEIETNQQSQMSVAYEGSSSALFKLILKTGFLTVITLGIYRFWAKARVRRYYWSAVQPGGHGFEYLGTGLEKFIGFLIAVVFLALYLGLFQLLLTFASIAFMSELAINLSFLAALPLIFYAAYRARRYILARTRWRGIRFGAEPAAIGYALRAMGYTVLSIITLGIMVPFQTFRLEKYVTDRTWYGDMKLEQGGTWTMLMKPWLICYGVVALAGGLIFLVVYSSASGIPSPGLLIFAILAFYAALIFGFLYYGVTSFRILADNKSAGNAVSFSSEASVGKVFSIYALGVVIMIGVSVVFFIGVALIMGIVIGSGFSVNADFAEAIASAFMGDFVAAIVAILFYVVVFLVFGAISHLVFIQPILSHYATTIAIADPHGEIDQVAQRAHDDSVEAEGFADALDVGAAI